MNRWLRNMFRREPPTPPPASAAQSDADQELLKAQQMLFKSTGEAAKAKSVAKRLQKINEQNHFAERALSALRGIVHE